MGRVSQSIPNLFNGVSQQAPTLRMRSQAEAQTNFYSTIAMGLAKRPPSKHIDQLLSSVSADAKIHWINRDEYEQYIVVIEKGNIQVFDLDGNSKTVYFTQGKSYLDCISPQEDFVTLTVADHTFIVNKRIATEINNLEADLLAGAGQDWADADVTEIGTPSTSAQVAYHDYQNWCWHVVSDAVDEGPKQKDFTSVTGTEYNVRFYLKVLSGAVTVKMRKGDDSGDISIDSSLSPSTWTAYDEDVAETAGGSGAHIKFIAETSSTEFYVDNLFVREITDDSWSPEAFVYVRTGVASTTYNVKVDTDVKSYTTTDTASTYKTTNIAKELTTAINTISGVTATQYGGADHSSIIKIVKDNGEGFTFRCTDSWGDQAMIGFYGTAIAFTDLPPRIFNGTKMCIAGDGTIGEDDYYLKHDQTEGRWNECAGWDQLNRFIRFSMPHVLVSNADGTFTFTNVTWDERTVGDSNSTPAPGFTGNYVDDIFFYRNRLGLVADDAVVLSKTGEYYNFFRDTVTQVLDTDVIDTRVSHTKVSNLKFAVPYAEDLLLFSEGTQFTLSAEDYLSPKTLQLDQTTEFENSPYCRPIGVGPNLYFTVARGDYTGIKEFYVDMENQNRDAADVTAHVPRYVPGGVFEMVGSSTDDIIFCLSNETGQRNTIYVYKFYWAGEQKLQSSWSKWELASSDTILSIFMISSTMYLAIKRSDGLYLEKIELQSNLTDGDLEFLVHLDRRVELTGSYSSETGLTTWTLPYPDNNIDRVILGSDFTGQVGNRITTIERPTSTTITAAGDYTDGECYCGKTYDATYQLSTQYLRTGQGKEEAISEGTLILQLMHLIFHLSGYFKIEITTGAGETYDYEHVMKLGTGEAVIGKAFIDSGVFDFPVMDFNDQVSIEFINDDYLPSTFESVEWEGNYVMLTDRN